MEKLSATRTGPNSIKINYDGIDFMIYSEYATTNPNEYSKIARINKCYVIGGATEEKCVSSSLFDPEGKLIAARNKTHLIKSELASGKLPGDGIFPFEINANGKKITILPILCYELLFPEDWIGIESKPNFVIHHIGFPMFNKGQDMDWFSMQKMLALRFKCDVVVACGNGEAEGTDAINNSGVVNYNSGRPSRILLEQKRS